MDFDTFARLHGLMINNLYPSERIRRAGTIEHPKKRNAAYLYTGDRGWVQRWDMGGELVWWNDPNAKERTQEDIDRWREQARVAAKKKDDQHAKAAQQAQQLLKEAKQAEHNYLHIKGFPGKKWFVHSDVLLVPMRDVQTDRLSGLQQIWWSEEDRKYNKKMLYGTKARGAVLILGDREASDFCLCEGFATGLSIQQACRSVGLRTAVVVTFSANNLTHVAPLIKGKRWVFADNDKSGTGEKCAKDTGLPYAMSEVVGFDANDHHKQFGQTSLVAMIMKVRAQC